MIILWDHRRICGPSLTETSLCVAYLIHTSVALTIPGHTDLKRSKGHSCRNF